MPSKGAPRKGQTKSRILIVDEQPLIRRGLSVLIENEADLSVCRAAADRRDGLDAISPSSPDLVITDLSFKAGDGLDMVKEIRLRHKHLPVLVLSMHDAPLYVERALQAGASGYVTKQEMSETILIAIRRVLAGHKYVSPKIRQRLARG